MIADFVDRRGGGLLMLGGARSFGEGGYGGTPVADALPLLIDPRTRASEPAALARLKVAPTRAGQAHAVTQIADTEAASVARWHELPQVTSVNAPLPLKPGATVLLNGTDERGRTQPVLASQQYGRGKAHRAHRCRTPGSGRCTRRFRSRIRRTSTSGGRCCAGWSTACPTSSTCGRRAIASSRAKPVTIEAPVVDKPFVELNDATVVAHGHAAGRRRR